MLDGKVLAAVVILTITRESPALVEAATTPTQGIATATATTTRRFFLGVR